MKKEQNARLRMMDAVKVTVTHHTAAWSGLESFETAWAEFMVLQEESINDLSAQMINTKGSTLTKADCRNALEEKTFRLGNALSLLAEVNAIPNLYEDAWMSRNAIRKLKGLTLMGHTQMLLDRATAHAAALIVFGIDASFIAETGAALEQFATAYSQPMNARMSRRDATMALEDKLSRMNLLLTKRLDPAAKVLSYTQPAFYSEYQSARKIIDPIRKTLALVVKVFNAKTGKALAGALATIEPGNLKKKSGAKGSFYVQELAPGKHKMTISKEGFLEELVEFVIVPKERLQLKVMLVKED